MDSDQITNILTTFAQWQHAFTFEELAALVDSDIDPDMLQRTIMHDSRFILLEGGIPDEQYFIAEKALFHWFSRLSIRLAQAQRVRLNSRQLAALMSSLHPYARWNIPPAGAIQFGQRFGFVGSAWESDQYVFPMAHMLSFMPLSRTKVASTILENFAEMWEPGLISEQLPLKSVQEGFSKISPRVRQVVQARESLLKGTKMTLEEIGISLGRTRERVRQIEAEFWKKVRHPSYSQHFITALLSDVMFHQGSLIIRDSSPEASLRKFIAKCAGIPHTEFPDTGIVILGASQKDIPILESTEWLPDEIDADAIATRLESEGQLCLIDSDLRIIAENIARYRQERLTKGQRVYLALKAIGKPAHYTEVTEVYNSLFPDYPSTECNIHAVLSREEYGIVWIGVRSTFALQEWGYEHPSKGLFEAVTEIVEKRFAETAKPVPFVIIVAEIGKYRRIVQPSSLTIAAHCNPRLERVYGDCFIPKASADQAQEEISAEELDRILREFEKQGSR